MGCFFVFFANPFIQNPLVAMIAILSISLKGAQHLANLNFLAGSNPTPPMVGLVKSASTISTGLFLMAGLIKRLSLCHLPAVSFSYPYFSSPTNSCFLAHDHCPSCNSPHLGPDFPPPCTPNSPCPWHPGAANGWPCYKCIKCCKQALQNYHPSTPTTVDAPTPDHI